MIRKKVNLFAKKNKEKSLKLQMIFSRPNYKANFFLYKNHQIFSLLAKVIKCEGIEQIKFLLFGIMDLYFIISSVEQIFCMRVFCQDMARNTDAEFVNMTQPGAKEQLHPSFQGCTGVSSDVNCFSGIDPGLVMKKFFHYRILKVWRDSVCTDQMSVEPRKKSLDA
jgi:hypothetical protein